MAEVSEKTSAAHSISEEAIRLQYGEAIECWRRQVVTCVQIVLGLAAVNATLVGIGFGQENTWMFLSGAALCCVGYLAARQGEFDLRVSILEAIDCERKLGLYPGLATTWFATSYGREDSTRVSELLEANDEQAGGERLLDAKIELVKSLRPAVEVRRFHWIVVLAAILQLSMWFFFLIHW